MVSGIPGFQSALKPSLKRLNSQLPGPGSSREILCLTQTRLVSFLLDLHQRHDLSWAFIGRHWFRLHSYWPELSHTEPAEGPDRRKTLAVANSD